MLGQAHGFPGRSTVKSLPAMQESWVQSLIWKDPLEEEMASHSSILDWEIPWTEETGRLWSMESQRVGHEGRHALEATWSERADTRGKQQLDPCVTAWSRVACPAAS